MGSVLNRSCDVDAKLSALSARRSRGLVGRRPDKEHLHGLLRALPHGPSAAPCRVGAICFKKAPLQREAGPDDIASGVMSFTCVDGPGGLVPSMA